jgi:hypothetical protein
VTQHNPTYYKQNRHSCKHNSTAGMSETCCVYTRSFTPEWQPAAKESQWPETQFEKAAPPAAEAATNVYQYPPCFPQIIGICTAS